MSTNLYFNNFGASQEQDLIESLIVESIKIYGLDMYYMKRTIDNRSATWNESTLTSFNSAILVEMYIKNVDGFQGDGEFLSKFGVEVRDQITFTMAMRTFDTEVGSITHESRPIEGNCIWFPLIETLYQIKFVNKRAIFYQLGALQIYDIVCELYEGNSDKFNTGIAGIDNVYNAISLSSNEYGILTEDGLQLITEDGEAIINENYNIADIDLAAQNDYFEQAGLDFIDFTEFDPFSEGGIRA